MNKVALNNRRTGYGLLHKPVRYCFNGISELNSINTTGKKIKIDRNQV